MKPLRCAVYTRKSTEDGLEQEFNSLDAQREACEAYILSQRQSTWGTQDPCVYEPGKPSTAEAPDGCLDSNLIFGGAFPWEVNLLALSDLAKAESWTMTPALPEIQAAMREMGDPARVVVSIYFRTPYVLDVESSLGNAGALLATFGVSDRAQLDIITGKAVPAGRLPFALPASRTAVQRQHPDAPGYDAEGTLYPFGFGLGLNAQGKQAAE